MTAVLTSRVWATWDAVFDALAAATWTTHPLTGKAPAVQFASSREVAKEMVTVPGIKPPTGPDTEQVVLGTVGRDERFTLLIVIWSIVPGYTSATPATDPSRAVRNRLRDLAAVVEGTFRDATTGRPKGISVTGVWNWSITSTSPAIGPIEGGYGGDLTMELSVQARL